MYNNNNNENNNSILISYGSSWRMQMPITKLKINNYDTNYKNKQKHQKIINQKQM